MTITAYRKKINFIYSNRKILNDWEKSFAESIFLKLKDCDSRGLTYKQSTYIDKIYLKLNHKQSLFTGLSDTPNVDMFKEYSRQNPLPEVVNKELDDLLNI